MSKSRETREALEKRVDPARLLVPLAEDLDELLNLLGADRTSQFARRTYIRSIATFVEAWTNAIKLLCTEGSRVAIQPFTGAELALLRDVAFDLNDKGEPVANVKFLKADRNFRFAFAAYAKLMGSDVQLRTDQNGWARFRDLIRLRNRLTHPRNPPDLIVTDIELEQAEQASKWFMLVTKELYDDGAKSYDIKRKRRRI